MATEVIMGAAQFVSFVLSFGASTTATGPINAGKSAVANLTKETSQQAFARVKTAFTSFFKQTVKKAKKAFIENIIDLPAGMAAEWVAENYCQGIYNSIRDRVNKNENPGSTDPVEILKKFDIFGISEIVTNCGDIDKKIECAQSVVSTASNFDPTGLLTIAAAFMHPTCEVVLPERFYVDPKSTWKKFKSVCYECENKTNTDIHGGGHVIFLDRHNMECQAGSVLNSVVYNIQEENLVTDYRCIKSSSVTNTCRDEYTQWNDFTYAEGSLRSLENHNIECYYSNYVLQKFKLEVDHTSRKIRYNYRCCMMNYINGTYNYKTSRSDATTNWNTENLKNANAIDGGSYGALKGLKFNTLSNPNKVWFDYKVTTFAGKGSSTFSGETVWTSAGSGSIWYLDRHSVSCASSNSAIRAFNYEWNNNDNMRYQFDCISNNNISNECETRNTKLSDIDYNEKKTINFLDRQNVSCMADESLRSFKLDRVDNRLSYKIECCKSNNISSYKNRWDKTDQGDRQSYYLDRQRVFVGVDETLKGFWIETSYQPDQMWYAWEANVLN
jgi:hypothetical protein